MALAGALVAGLLGQRVAIAAAAAAASDDAARECGMDGQAEGCSASALTRDHQLLQVGGGKLHVTQKDTESHTTPGQFDCEGMQDVKKVCSDNSCKVLAKNMLHKTCDQYCIFNGRTCVSAAEEIDDSCMPLAKMFCGQVWRDTSDLLCECSAGPSNSKGGAPATLGDHSNLKLVWADEFDGDLVDTTKWSMHEGGGGFGNWELQYYTSRAAHVADGTLRITAKCESFRGQGYTSAKLETKHKGDWGPGHRIEVRARVPNGKGTWPAIWMLSTDEAYGRWPRSGEIDMMETVGCTANKVYGTVHTEAYNHMLHTEKYNTIMGQVDEWHTYAIEWTETQIAWYFDGQLFHSFAPNSYEHQKWPYSHKFYLILNVAVGGSWGGYCLQGTPSCSAADEFGHPQVLEVDYARVYAL